MKESKITRRALVGSVISIVLCLAMLVGATFAWFTDTASTNVNRVQSGTLDVELLDEAGHSVEGKTLEWQTADGRAQDQILWEPGATYNLQPVTIKNNGNLALKYKIQITGIQGNAELNDAIEWTANGVSLDKENHLVAGAISTLTISGHMKEDAGNAYQNKSINNIAITVIATQDTVENDSYSNAYDENAVYPEIVKAENLSTALDTVDEGSVISVEGTVTDPITIDKAVTIQDLTITDQVKITANGVQLDNANIKVTGDSKPALVVEPSVDTVTVSNSTITSNTGKPGTHCAVSIPVAGKVIFTNNTVINNYNGLEFGLNAPLGDGSVISNNTFINCGNNGLSIYQVEEGATITIANNTFTSVSNAIRLSNSNNATGTFNIENNIVDTDHSWGKIFVLLEDYSGDSSQDFTKYTLNFNGNTLGANSHYAKVYDDINGFLPDTNQPNVTVK